MKKLFYLMMTVAVMVTACNKDDKDNKQEPVDTWNSYVLIKPDESFKLKAQKQGLTPAEIVEQSAGIWFKSHYRDNTYFEENKEGNRGTPEFLKDYENNVVKMWASDIIMNMEGYEGQLREDFITAIDVYFTNEAGDSIAYIPNEVLRTAEPLIREAYANEDYEEVNRLFDEAYTYKAIED